MESDVEKLVTAIGARIRAARKARGLSQEELAARGGCSRRSLCMLELGKWSPSIELLAGLAKALDVRLAELLDDGYSGRQAPATAASVEERRIAETIKALPSGDRRALLKLAKSLAAGYRRGGYPERR